MAGEEKIISRHRAGQARGGELLPDGDVAVAGTGQVGRSGVARFHLVRPRAARGGDLEENGRRWKEMMHRYVELEDEVRSRENGVVVHDDLHIREAVAVEICLNTQI